MSFSGILYSIFIRPIETLFDVIFYRSYSIIGNVGISIILVSLIVNFLVLPLYNRADKMQFEENEKRKRIKPWEDHIKKSFKGNERFMLLQAYYRQNDYKPYQTLKSAMPLLLEIPFFIAAYHYLSNLQLISGVSFGPIRDLGSPDGLVKISGLSINILPILMTVINIISATVYNRNTSFKSRLQTYIMAVVFLVLLYNSPSGLAFYWTLNNVFSLCKNIVYRFIPVKDKKEEKTKKDTPYGFIIANALLAMLVGFLIPTTVVKSSVQEFIDIVTLENPVHYIITGFLTAVGFFVVWMGIYYYLSGDKIKRLFSKAACSLALIAILEYVAMPDDYNMTKNLNYNNTPVYTAAQHVQGIVIFVAAVFVCFVLYEKKKNVLVSLLFAGLVVFFVVGVANTFSINSEYQKKSASLRECDDYPEIHLSKNGKNVIVIMMDRMVSYYIPYIFNEMPELYDQFDGFTYYPNSVSYGTATNSGSPALYGGYDYTPLMMNERSNVLLEDKQNEALKVMPLLFLDKDFDVTVCDPTYAGYDWIPDLRIYNDYPEIHKYITNGRMTPTEYKGSLKKRLNRNFVFYGLYRTSPSIIRSFIYDYGNYNSAMDSASDYIGFQSIYNSSKSEGLSEEFFDAYSVLDGMAGITKIDDSDKGCFTMMSNDTTHADNMLVEPGYTPSLEVDNTDYDAAHKTRTDWNNNTISLFDDSTILMPDGSVIDGSTTKVIHYQINACALIKLGNYLDYLKENGVYDNTRIILVSDHSAPLSLDSGLICDIQFENGSELKNDLLSFQSTLLVKDFDSEGFNVDGTFMTNADVPSIATEGLIDNACNPFSGNPLKSNEKNEMPVYMMATEKMKTEENNGYVFVPAHWFSVHDNIFDGANWAYEGVY